MTLTLLGKQRVVQRLERALEMIKIRANAV